MPTTDSSDQSATYAASYHGGGFGGVELHQAGDEPGVELPRRRCPRADSSQRLHRVAAHLGMHQGHLRIDSAMVRRKKRLVLVIQASEQRGQCGGSDGGEKLGAVFGDPLGLACLSEPWQQRQKLGRWPRSHATPRVARQAWTGPHFSLLSPPKCRSRSVIMAKSSRNVLRTNSESR